MTAKKHESSISGPTERSAEPDLFCDCCDVPLTSETVQWRIGPDDVTDVPFCQRCVRGGFWGRWRGLSTLQKVFVVGFLAVAVAIAGVLASRHRSPGRQAGVLLERARAQRAAGEVQLAYETLATALALEPDNAAACGELGYLYSDALGRPQDSLVWFERSLQRDPRDAACRLALVRAAMSVGSDSLAFSELRNHLVGTQQFDALYLRAMALDKAGQLDGAATLFAAMTVLSPDNALGWVLLAGARERQGGRHRDEAGPLYRHAAAVSPGSPGARYQLGKHLLDRGSISAAIDELAVAHRLAPENDLFLFSLVDALMLSGARPEALRRLVEARRVRPGDVMLRLRHAAVLFDLGRHDEMNQLLTDGLRERPGQPLLLQALARVAFLRDELPRAEGLLRQVIVSPDADSPRSSARALLAELLVLTQRSAEAASLLEEEVRERPDDVGLSLMLATSYLQRGLASDALRVVTPLLGSSTDDPSRAATIEALFEGGVATRTGRIGLELALTKANHARRKRDWAGVVGALDDVASLADRLPVLHFRKAYALEQQRKWQEAASCYRAALAANPDFWRAANNLAFLYADRLLEPQKARALLQKMPAAIKNDPTVADTLAWTAVQLGEPATAISILEPLVTEMPTVGVFHLHLAHALAAVGNDDRARAELLAAVMVAPDLRDDVHYLSLCQRMTHVPQE